MHALSQAATDAFEGARERVRRFINAASTREIIFVRGTTEAINLVAQSYGRPRLAAGRRDPDHAPSSTTPTSCPGRWCASRPAATLKVAPINRRGELEFDEYLKLLSPRTRMVGDRARLQRLGTVLPVKRIIDAAHARRRGSGGRWRAGRAAHTGGRARARGDFYAFSGHKIYGPTGIGVLYGREALLAAMPPWQGGGDMILTVSFEKTTYNELPYKFEAGTPNISGAVGLGRRHGLPRGAWDRGSRRPRGPPAAARHRGCLRAAGDQGHRHGGAQGLGPVLHDGRACTRTTWARSWMPKGVAVRTGHHCAMPVMSFFGLAATARASFACYNNDADIDAPGGGAAEGAPRCSADGTEGPLPRPDPRSQQAPA